MTPAQKSALEALTATAATLPRSLSQAEIDEITPLVASGNTQAIADILSVGRTRPVYTEIGIGTVLAVVGEGGGLFLDELVAAGEVDRNVYWAFKLIERGNYRIDMPASRVGMQALAESKPNLAQGIAALLTLGVEPDPITHAQIGAALKGD